MGVLPNALSLSVAVGSQLNQTYQFLNSDGTLMNIVGKIFEFNIRNDPIEAKTVTPVASVTSTVSTASGVITVNTLTSTVLVSVSSSAMSNLTQKQYVYTLWMDQNLADATAMVSGTLFANFPAAQF